PLHSRPGPCHLRLRWLPRLRRLLRGCPRDLLLLHHPPPRSSCFYPRLRPWTWLRLWSRLWPPPWLWLWPFRLWSWSRLWTRPSRLWTRASRLWSLLLEIC
ncbi:hypothetical protein IscW_ISCW004864, partial [Ixodes scapularis]